MKCDEICSQGYEEDYQYWKCPFYSLWYIDEEGDHYFCSECGKLVFYPND